MPGRTEPNPSLSSWCNESVSCGSGREHVMSSRMRQDCGTLHNFITCLPKDTWAVLPMDAGVFEFTR